MLPPPSYSQRIRESSGLSHSQIQIWTGQKVHPESALYNMAFLFRLDGDVDPAAFREAFRAVVEASDALSTSVREPEGLPIRASLAGADIPFEFVDLSESTDGFQRFREASLRRCAMPLRMDGPLLEATLAKLGAGRFAWYLNQHHLITDASSTVILFRRVAEAYERAVAGRSLAVQLPSFYAASESLNAYGAKRLERAAAHWAAVKERGSRVVRFFGRKPSPETFRSERLSMRIGSETTARLKRLAAEPPFQSLLPDISMFGIFATLLSAFLRGVSGQERVGFDAPAQNRPTPEAKRALGCFIEMFPIGIDIDANETFRSLGAKCMGEVIAFLANVLPGASSPDGATASNVVLNYFNGAFGSFAGLPVSAEWIHSGSIDSVYDLKLQVHNYDGEDGLSLDFDLDETVFPERIRASLPTRFAALTQAMLADIDQAIASVDLTLESERIELRDRYNATSSAPLPQRSVIERIVAQAKATPGAPALRQKAKTYSYGELLDAVDALARSLRSRGVGAERVVAIAMNRSADAVIAILAVLRAGGAYVPIDPRYPSERISYILQDAGAALALVERATADRISSAGLQIIVCDEWISDARAAADLSAPSLGDLAYVIYTSGSTGQPKGVEIEHAGLMDYLEWAEREYVRGDALAYPLFTSLSFDLTITSLFLPLMTGGLLIVYEEPTGGLDSAVIDVVNENAVDFIKLTPSHLSLLRQLDLSRSRIARMVVGGEDLKRGLAAAIAEQRGGLIEIYNEYGPTECVVGCMIHRFDPLSDEASGSSVPIGKPADHVRLYLLNEAMQLVPEGTPGELCVARHGLSRGYRNALERTARSFVANPFEPGGRLYRTGDLARFREPGVMEFLGRVDQQLKISGFRVEPSEVEAALCSCEGVESAYVTSFRPLARRVDPSPVAHCARCGISSRYPGIRFSNAGVCNVCESYEAIKERAAGYFRQPEELQALFAENRRRGDSEYDCMVFFSGGKDSAYALAKLVDLGVSVYAFTLDNGYLSEQAMANIRRVVESLGVPHEFGSTPAMDRIFKDSLMRFSNVCNGCFKTIYTLGVNRARSLGIRIVVTGLSRGQFFETRLTEGLFKSGSFNPCQVDAAVLEARRAYHRMDDEVARTLDVGAFARDELFEEIQFVDFYRYWDASLQEIYSYLARRVPWFRPTDTGRSTNCRVNDVGIYIHKKERGFHNYELPYSWDVRMGHKSREQALEELNDSYDVQEVRKMLAKIGYDEDRIERESERRQLVAYYATKQSLDESALRARLQTILPSHMIPSRFIALESMPLTRNGKIDTAKLPAPEDPGQIRRERFVAPAGPVQERVAQVWRSILGVADIGARDSFFRLGGTSLGAMEAMLQLCGDFELDLPLQTLFKHPTLDALAEEIERATLAEIESLSEEEAAARAGAD